MKIATNFFFEALRSQPYKEMELSKEDLLSSKNKHDEVPHEPSTLHDLFMQPFSKEKDK